jgi:hypothetical protein
MSPEGIIAKRIDMALPLGRSKAWIKVRNPKAIEDGTF